ncbi:MAG TPA: 1-phosphofructokinase [Thermoanaerobaculia bacterium]|jgi:1-phosphofructokinase family hexose kinase|nr:1-phosphofructokinase [Thermoanaerobaculia bacterium]
MSKPRVVTVTLNPAIDQTLSIPGFAAGRVNRVAESRSDAGGKGVNVACCLADLGVEVTATGFLGAENADIFEASFTHRGIADLFVRVLGRTRVGIKIVDDRTGQTTDINFPGLAPEAEDLVELFERIFLLVEPGGWFVLSGSVPAGTPDVIYARMIELLQDRGGHVVLDTSGGPLREALTSGPEVVKPNIEELGELVGRTLATPADVRAAGESLLERGVRLVVVSMGGDGAVFVDREQALLARPPKVQVRSTVGAGDAMVGGIVHAKLQGMALADLARFATASGAYAVTRVGPGIEDRDSHRKLIEQVEIEDLK